MKSKTWCLLTVASVVAQLAGGQPVYPPSIEWQRSFGGTNDDRLRSLCQTDDGGFMLGGFSNSAINGNKTGTNFGSYDFWVVRLDANGNKLWDQSYGGAEEDVLYSLQPTRDGGFLLGGYSLSGASGNKTSTNSGGYDFWVVRIDADGNRLWDRSFGGSNDDFLRSVWQTTDGGFLLGGQSLSGANGNKTSSNFGTNDFWVVRLNTNGDSVWDRSFGGISADRLQTLRQTSDGGFVLGGVSLSGATGNKTSSNYGLNDFWLVRLDANGNKLWDRSFGGTDNDELLSLDQAVDGGFILGGFSWSGANGNKTARGAGGSDMWLVFTDANGNKLGDFSYGGRDSDSARSLQRTLEGGFILGGISDSGTTGNKTSPYFGGIADFWVVRVDAAGNKLWDQSYGGTTDDGIWSLQQTRDGGFIFGGGSDSIPSGNKTAPRFGNYDFWAVKLRSEMPLLRIPAQSSIDLRRDGCRIFLSGVTSNYYRSEYTSNWTSWTPLQTNQVTGAEMEIIDRGATNRPMRYYRARLLP